MQHNLLHDKPTKNIDKNKIISKHSTNVSSFKSNCNLKADLTVIFWNYEGLNIIFNLDAETTHKIKCGYIVGLIETWYPYYITSYLLS